MKEKIISFFYVNLHEITTCQAEKAKLDLKSKDVQMKKLEETVNGLEQKLKERDVKNKSLQDKVLGYN